MDTRHFELQDLLSAALIALEAGDGARVEAALRRALAWVEHDWLATPAEISRPALAAGGDPTAAEDDEDD